MKPLAATWVLPVRAPCPWLKEALASVAAQSFEAFECLVVMDGDDPSANAAVDDFCARDARFRRLQSPGKGMVDALNHGIAAARGEYIVRMDADDVALPDRLARQLAWLAAHPGVVAVGGGRIVIDEKGRELSRPRPRTRRRPHAPFAIPPRVRTLIHPSATIRRDALLAAGGYRRLFAAAQDFDLWLRLRAHGRIERLDDPVIRYRQHPNSVSSRNWIDQLRFQHLALLSHYQLSRGAPDVIDAAGARIRNDVMATLGDDPYARRLEAYFALRRRRAFQRLGQAADPGTLALVDGCIRGFAARPISLADLRLALEALRLNFAERQR